MGRENSGVVFNIERHALHDGPGIRTLVFLKGCPLRCRWCGNPEGMLKRPQILYDERLCRHCGKCVAACANKALSVENETITTHYDKCIGCGSCVNECLTDAIRLSGKQMTAEEVVYIVERDKVFYDVSGGGVTFSGGEPTFQFQFLVELLKLCKQRGIETAIETTGYCPPEKFIELIPLIDVFLYDVKHVDDEKHRENTGVSCAMIKENLKTITELGGNVIVRIPLIPGFNVSSEDIDAIAEFLVGLERIPPVHLLPYHLLGKPKYAELKKEYPMGDTPPLSIETANELVERFQLKRITASVEV